MHWIRGLESPRDDLDVAANREAAAAGNRHPIRPSRNETER
jgi:hypothetical protein